MKATHTGLAFLLSTVLLAGVTFFSPAAQAQSFLPVPPSGYASAGIGQFPYQQGLYGNVPQMSLGGFTAYGPYAGYGNYGGGYSGLGGYGGGYGGYGAVGGYGWSAYGGYGPYGGYGFGGPLAYGQQLYQMQALQTQQIFQSQQQGILSQLGQAQQRLAGLEQLKQESFSQYLNASDADKAKLQANLARDYVGLPAERRAAWQQDPLVRIIMGRDNWWPQLEAVVQFMNLDQSQQSELRASLRRKYDALPADQRATWQQDSALQLVMGRGAWWQ